MQNETTSTDTVNETAITETAASVAAIIAATTEKPANVANAAKRVRAKRAKQSTPATPAAKQQPAKPTQAAREAAQREQNDSRRLARTVAASAVAAFYSGASKPFKAASDRFSDLNPANGKAPSTRQAALLLALITHGRGNIKADGSFVRGGFVVPARLVNPSAKADETIRAQPESGCLGNMLGRAVDYVNGPLSGKAQSESTFRLRPARAIAEIQAAFGDKPANAAAALLTSYGVKLDAKPARKPAKRQAA